MKYLQSYNESIRDFLKPKSMEDTIGKDDWMKIEIRSYRTLKSNLRVFTNDEKQKIDEVLGVDHTKEDYCHFIIYDVIQKNNNWSLILGYDNIDRFCFRKQDGYFLCLRLGQEEYQNRVNPDVEFYVMSSFDGFIKFIKDFNIKKQIRVNYRNDVNESIRDFLKPKSEDEIKNKLDGLPLLKKINTIIRYKLYPQSEITEMINSLSVSELKDVLLHNNLLFYYITKENLEKIYPIITQIYNMVKNSPFWKIKNLRDYKASQYVNDSQLTKLTYTYSDGFFYINLYSYDLKHRVTIKVYEDINGELCIRIGTTIHNTRGDTRIVFNNIEEFFDILQTNPNFPEPLRKYFTFESTFLPSNIDKIEHWISKRRNELDSYNESIKDFLKPKSQEDILKRLNKLPDNDQFIKGCEFGITWLVKDLIDNGFDPSYDNNRAIKLASRYGYLDIVKELLKDERVDPSNNYNLPIRYASLNGHLEVVRELLKDERVDPSDDHNTAIIYASRYGHLEIVKELLKDERVDPSVDDNYSIRYASDNGHLDVVKELLKDKRVDPSDSDNYAIRYASENGHLQVVKELLKDKRVDPSDINNCAIIDASFNGHLDVVKELLKDERVLNKLSKKHLEKYKNQVEGI